MLWANGKPNLKNPSPQKNPKNLFPSRMPSNAKQSHEEGLVQKQERADIFKAVYGLEQRIFRASKRTPKTKETSFYVCTKNFLPNMFAQF